MHIRGRQAKRDFFGSAEGQIGVNGNVVGRLFPGPDMPVDAGGHKGVGCLRGEQDMVDPDPPILLPGAGLIVPEGIEPGRIGRCTQRVYEAEIGDGTVLFPGLRAEQSILDPSGRIVDVSGGRDDVVVTCKDKWLF